MDRRTLLKRTSAISGVILSPGIVNTLLTSCAPEKLLNWKPVFLSVEQAKDLNAIANIIIPGNREKPGAEGTQTDKLIDIIINDCFSPSEKEKIMTGFEALNEKAKDLGENFFHLLDTEDQIGLIKDLDLKIEEDNTLIIFYKRIKSLTISGYLSSKEGLTYHYNYVPVPGKFLGCITLGENEKIWKGASV